MPVINNLIVGISVGFSLGILIGTPIFGGNLFGIIFWTILVFVVMCLTDFPISGWSFYMEGSILIQLIAPALIFSIILNVFPIAV
jgi:hypothetical protein